jgi:hypothetical protein
MVRLTGPVKELKRACEYIEYQSRHVLKFVIKKNGTPGRPHTRIMWDNGGTLVESRRYLRIQSRRCRSLGLRTD